MTIYIMLIVWLLTVSLVPFTIRKVKDGLEEAENATSLDAKATMKIILSIPFVGTAMMILLWIAYLKDYLRKD